MRRLHSTGHVTQTDQSGSSLGLYAKGGNSYSSHEDHISWSFLVPLSPDARRNPTARKERNMWEKKQSLVEMWEEEREPGGIIWSLEPLNPVVEPTGFHEPNNVQLRLCSSGWFSIFYTQKCPEWFREFLPFSHSFTHSTKHQRHCPSLESWAETAAGPWENCSLAGWWGPPRRNWGFQGMCQGGPPQWGTWVPSPRNDPEMTTAPELSAIVSEGFFFEF